MEKNYFLIKIFIPSFWDKSFKIKNQNSFSVLAVAIFFATETQKRQKIHFQLENFI
jgi:hypothetical protein